ncbi:MAG: mucoidy inhibitor MuiA family protein, partial [Pedobacter sp.]
SYIGYQTLDQSITANQMNVRLQPDTKALNEVVVAAYGAVQKKESTTSDRMMVRAASALTSVPIAVNTVENQTNITFDIQNPYTILSDGKQFTVDIGNYDFNAEYEYYAAPKITEDAFLTAKISGFDQINLISGEASVFFEGTFLGKTLLDVQTASDTLKISLGVDKNVVIKREKQKDFNERQFIGSSQRDSRHFVIDVKNRKSQAINLIVEDQLPLATSSDITVEKQEISKAKLDETNGKLTWQMQLQPNEQKKLVLKYQVKYPKNKPINLE